MTICIFANLVRAQPSLPTRYSLKPQDYNLLFPLLDDRSREPLRIRHQIELSPFFDSVSILVEFLFHIQNHFELDRFRLRKALKSILDSDKVWLSSENIMTTHPAKKLDYRWLGPYTIEQVISRNAYQLKLPASFGRVHPVFSITLLRPLEGDLIAECQEQHPPLPPPIVHDGIKE